MKTDIFYDYLPDVPAAFVANRIDVQSLAIIRKVWRGKVKRLSKHQLFKRTVRRAV